MPDPTTLTSDALLALVQDARWFGAKDKTPEGAGIVDLPVRDAVVTLAMVEVRFGTGTHEHYLLDFAADGSADVLERPEVAVRLAELAGVESSGATVEALGVEQSNSSVMLDQEHVLKLYRRLEAGPNPEIEMLRALQDEGFTNAPRLEGALETPGPPLETSLVSITGRVPAEGGGWELTVDSLGDDPSWLPERAWRLGEVTAGLHGALAAHEDDPSFAPEEPSSESLQLFAAAIDEEISATFGGLPEDDALGAVAHRAEDLRDLVHELAAVGPAGLAIRTHGDYHLGQVLWSTDADWVVIDFEGEPARSLPERRRKRSPLRDLAGMTRSFAYAADAGLLLQGPAPPEGWVEACRSALIEGYLESADELLAPPSRSSFDRLLALFELGKLVYELRYEARNRPAWPAFPVVGLLRLPEPTASAFRASSTCIRSARA